MKILGTLLLALTFYISAAHSSETVNGMKQDIAAFKKEMNEQLESVAKQLDELRAKAKSSGNKAQQKAVKDLEQTQAQLRSELNSLKDDTKRNWKDIRKSISNSFESLHEKIQKSLND